MKFRIKATWPTSDILPQVREVGSASAALRACASFLRSGCRIDSITVFRDDGSVSRMAEGRLVRLARDEGCGIRYPPHRRRKARQTMGSVAFAILCSILPNSWGDFATLLDFGTNRVAIRRSQGSRPDARRR
ncbi:MAG: hypothetical protein J0J01_21875 [Reyranella sp.]|uniref:hypothetical protein n=1 Tax=Reyranella sp. TaxID=1929291 RepID=UPI001AC8C324|nr:hypothetical protein [Reyranella sp.]MBN9089570.1 hypothetical protein [Reyranella sp.]